VSDDETSIPAPPPARGVQLVRPDATWRYEVVTAPLLATQIGALAASGLDVAAGRAQAPIDVLGDDKPPPAGWPLAIDGGATGALPRDAPVDHRTTALYAVTTFALTKDQEGLRMIEIRARYEDGIAIWLNGIEVVRKALPRGSTALAAMPHGPEWETFYVPAAPGLLRLGDNSLAFEVHPSGRRRAPELAVDVIGRRELGIVRGPIVAEVGSTTATIAVDTDPGIDAAIEWGTGGTLDHRASSTGRQHHRFALTDLPPHAQFSYRVHAGGVQSPLYRAHTAPGASDVVRIGVYGDVRGGHVVHRRLVDAMLGEALDLVCVTGDMVLHGSDEADWQRFFTVTGELLAQVHYLPAVGNHDLGWEGAAVAAKRAEDVFALPAGPPNRPAGAYWYSYDIADVHLVFLDSNAYERAEQETWLDDDLAAARKRGVRAILAFTHEPPYSRGLHRGNALARTRYVPILARHHVDLLLAGHDHLYQRGEATGIRYVVSGGGGASLYPISCGVSGKPDCKVDDGKQAVFKEHHYVVLAIAKDAMEMCARRADGTLLEKCVRYKLWRP
jgi:hypothetical protein